MASAVLASRNESSWGQSGGVFMGKLPYSNHLNPNPNPKSIPKKKQIHALGAQPNGRQNEDSPAVTQTASDDAYSFNQRPIESNGNADFNTGGYISFNLASCTRGEMIELKKRLVSELEKIKRLNERIECWKFQTASQSKSKKRPSPFVSTKDPKRVCQTTSDNGVPNPNEIGNSMKMCRLILTKLMKHKHSWIFNKPVDAAGMGLHDYHLIVKRPMDLGTVKSNLGKNLYSSTAGFAADVRLTFNNALLYNPKGDEVHNIAEQLLSRFEELYRPTEAKYEGDQTQKEQKVVVVNEEVQGSSWNNQIPAPEKPKKSKSKSKSDPMPSPEKHEEIQVPVKPAVVRANSNQGKLPKPKAKDPNKREMSMEEKQRLGVGLQSLPQEKMPQLVQIIGKRNEHLAQEGDEIELDIEALDTETLWELDRFVTNWKKMVSKNKRQALMVTNSGPATGSGEDNVLSVSEKTDTVKKPKRGGEAGEEDVDIGDEMPMSSFPPVEIEKDDGGGHDNSHAATSSSSSSGSSSSDSSSSSGSDSGSSSGSDSDADDAQSRGLESKEFSKT